jgi:hypothetical protein
MAAIRRAGMQPHMPAGTHQLLLSAGAGACATAAVCSLWLCELDSRRADGAADDKATAELRAELRAVLEALPRRDREPGPRPGLEAEPEPELEPEPEPEPESEPEPQPKHGPAPELEHDQAPALEPEPEHDPAPEPEPEPQWDQELSTNASEFTAASPPRAGAPPPPGSAEKWQHEAAEALAAEAAAAAFVSESESGSPSPRPTVQRPAKIIEADERELELEVEGRAYLVDRTTSLVFSLDGAAAEPQMIGTWDEGASLVSFYLDDDDDDDDDNDDDGAQPNAAASPPMLPASNSSAAGSSPSPPPAAPPQGPRVTFQTPSQRQDTPLQLEVETLQLELDRISRRAHNREAELLSRLDSLRTAQAQAAQAAAAEKAEAAAGFGDLIEQARAEAAAAERAKWRREIGEERISAAQDKASALQAQEADATRIQVELRLRMKAEMDAARRGWRRELGAERISTAEEQAARDRKQTAASIIQHGWRRRRMQMDFRALIMAAVATRTGGASAQGSDNSSTAAVADGAGHELPEVLLALRQELAHVRASCAAKCSALAEETRGQVAAAEQARDGLIERLDQVCRAATAVPPPLPLSLLLPRLCCWCACLLYVRRCPVLLLAIDFWCGRAASATAAGMAVGASDPQQAVAAGQRGGRAAGRNPQARARHRGEREGDPRGAASAEGATAARAAERARRSARGGRR